MPSLLQLTTLAVDQFDMLKLAQNTEPSRSERLSCLFSPVFSIWHLLLRQRIPFSERSRNEPAHRLEFPKQVYSETEVSGSFEATRQNVPARGKSKAAIEYQIGKQIRV
jgi:hypothetical protein